MEKKFRIGTLMAFVFVFAVQFLMMIFREIGSLDELWIFNMGLNVSRGLTPYSQVSIITFPLSQLLSAGFIKIFGEYLIVIRVIGLILAFADMIMLYFIMRKIGIAEGAAAPSIAVIGCLTSPCMSYDYNFLILTMVLGVVLLQLNAVESGTFALAIWSSVLGCCCFFCKQTVGAIVWLAVFIVNMRIFNKKKQRVKLLWINLAMGVLSLGAMIGYFSYKGALNDLIRYTVTGVGEFDNHISVLEFAGTMTGAIVIGLSMIAAVMAVCDVAKNKTVSLKILLCYWAALTVLMFPIADVVHSVQSFILMSAIIVKVLQKKMAVSDNSTLSVTAVGIISLIMALMIQEPWKIQFSQLKHYELIPTESSFENSVAIVDDSIKQLKGRTAIADASAAAFLIPLDIYNKDLDMLLKGNVGGKADEMMKGCIDSYDHILIAKDEVEPNWQFPKEIKSIVREHGIKSGEIGNFEIYEIRKGTQVK